MMSVSKCATIVLVTVTLCLQIWGGNSAKKKECEVCEKFMQRFIDSLTSDEKSDTAVIEKKFKKMCKDTKGKENSFCYYVGGLKESATSTLTEMSKPVSWSMPANKICEKLDKRDSQICELRYEKTIDWKNTDLKKLKVKDLKKILSDWGEECKGCTEKSEFIKLIEQLKPKFVRDDL